MEKKWVIRQPIDSTTVESFRSELKVSSVLAELLLQRGISTFQEAELFFRAGLEKLHDPFLMKNMQEAVNRLQQAIDQKEKVMLFGDYDVDGTTSVALMYSYLKDDLPQLMHYFPDRYKEGYGLSKMGIDKALSEKCTLLITLDCGIKSVELIDYAKRAGLDVIVCDHHQPGEKVPDCIVLDPKQEDCNYPYKELCGCGVGFKLLQGYIQQVGRDLHKLYELLDFVAVAIGADIVPVTGENRILAQHGMRLFNEQKRLSFKELLRIAKRSYPVTLTDVVFTIAPRINAAGRLYSGDVAFELMVSENQEEIDQLASDIDSYNSERRGIEGEITEEALQMMQEDEWYKNAKSTVVFSENWHKGVVGIVASRLIEQYFRPTIVLTENDGLLTGSARTINDFDIYKAIEACEDLLVQFGGHKHAAGLTLEKKNFLAFRERFEEVVSNSISIADQQPIEFVDLIISFDTIFDKDEDRRKVPKFKRILKQMEPHGPQNMKPLFWSKNVYSQSVKVLKEQHLKLAVTQPNSDVVLDAIGFFMADKMEHVVSGVPFEMLYTVETNIWNGAETVQLNIKDIRPI